MKQTRRMKLYISAKIETKMSDKQLKKALNKALEKIGTVSVSAKLMPTEEDRALGEALVSLLSRINKGVNKLRDSKNVQSNAERDNRQSGNDSVNSGEDNRETTVEHADNGAVR